MILTVTLNPALDKVLLLNDFEVHKLHRLLPEENSYTQAGGKGVNIALALKEMGDDVVATGFAGGHEGHMLCDQIRQHGITTSFIFTEEPTRTNISIIDRKHETLTEVNDFGQNIVDEDQEFFIDNFKSLLPRTKIAVLAGSVPRGMPNDFYRTLLELTKLYGVKVMLHTSEKYLTPVMDIAPFVIIPDMRSSHELFGKPIDSIDEFISTGRDILLKNKDTEFVIFTHRIERVVAITRANVYVLSPLDLNIVNMLGYADAYAAGFIHAYKEGRPIREVLEYASAAGLTNVESIQKITTDIKTITENIKRIKVEEY